MLSELEQLNGVHASYLRYLEVAKDREPRLNDGSKSFSNNMQADFYALQRRRLYFATFALNCGFALAIILGLQSGYILKLPTPIEAPKINSIEDRLTPVQAQLRDVSKILSILVPAVIDGTTAKMENKITNEKKIEKNVSIKVQGKVTSVTADKTLLRDAPNTEAKVITEVQQGADLLVLGREGDWYQVFSPKGEQLWADINSVSAPTEHNQ